MCVAYFVKECSVPVAIRQGRLTMANAHLCKHWIFRKFVRSTILHKFHLLKFCFCQIKELCEIFRLRPFTLWLHCPKIFEGPLKFVLNDPLNKQWIKRELVRSTIFQQIHLLKFYLHHFKELALWNAQTEMIHFIIGMFKNFWGPIEIWSWPPGVLNDPLKNNEFKRNLCEAFFPTNSPIEILFAPFERALLNLQTAIVHFVISLSKKLCSLIWIGSRPPVVLNNLLKKQWILR